MAISVSNPFVQAFMGQISAAEDKRKQEEQNALNLMMSGFDVAPQQTKGVGDALSQALYGPSTAVSRASVGQHHPGEIQKRIQEMVNASFEASNRSKERIANADRASREKQAGLDRTSAERMAGQRDATDNRRIEADLEQAFNRENFAHIRAMAKERTDAIKRYLEYQEKMAENQRLNQLTPDDHKKYLELQQQVQQYLTEAAENTWQDWFAMDSFGMDEKGLVAKLTDPNSIWYNEDLASYKAMTDGLLRGSSRLIKHSTEGQAEGLTGTTPEQEVDVEIDKTVEEVVKEAGEAPEDPTLNDVDKSISTGSKRYGGSFDTGAVGQLFNFLSKQAQGGTGRPSTRNWEELVRQYQAATGDTVTRPINGKTLYERVTEWRASQ